ncbi:unnamed protein product [Symbiodinium natans]|uniref:Uncharacterized protein n=1 Tax=Symbiodinium natans TaxID=878477 RepID=A0A812UEA3_9DINO|nr:unnamed protein product [Symbiodinium natans]
MALRLWLALMIPFACAEPLGEDIYRKFVEISQVLEFNHAPDALESIRDWVQEDVTEWAPQGELELRKHIVTLMYGDDEDEMIRALRVYGNVCEMHMMLGSHLFVGEAVGMQADPRIASVLNHLKFGTDEQNAYGLADAVYEHLNSSADLFSFGTKMQAARQSMQNRRGSEL